MTTEARDALFLLLSVAGVGMVTLIVLWDVLMNLGPE